MILFLLAALCIASVPLTGGQLRRLAEIRLRWLWAAPVALAIQVVIMSIIPGGHPSLHAAVHVATYALIGVFMWANRRLPGVPVIAAGTSLNTIAIVTNSGVMPRSADAARLAGLTVGRGFHNSAVLAHPHVLWLGDIIPAPLPFPFRNVLSIGDCIIFAGMIVLLHRACGSRWDLRWRGLRGATSSNLAPVDAVLGAALTSFERIMELWEAGEPATSPAAQKALAAFATCRRAAVKLPPVRTVKRSQIALDHIGLKLESWSEGAPLDPSDQRLLRSAARILTSARTSTSSVSLSAPINPRYGLIPKLD